MPTKYFPRDTNADVTCDGTNTPKDMSETQGTPTTQNSTATSSMSFVEVMSFDIDVSGDSPATGDHDCSVDCSTFISFEWRYRLQAVDDSGCAVDNSSAYSATYTSTGIKTDTLNLTWAGSSERLRLSIEIRQALAVTRNIILNVNDADTFVNAPWPVDQQLSIVGQKAQRFEGGLDANHKGPIGYFQLGRTYPRSVHRQYYHRIRRPIILGGIDLEKEFTHTTDALLRAEETFAHTTDAALSEADFAHTTDALLRAEETFVHTTDALLRTAETFTHTTDALLRAEETFVHTTDALLRAAETFIHTTDSLLSSQDIFAHTTDSFLYHLSRGTGELTFAAGESFGLIGIGQLIRPTIKDLGPAIACSNKKTLQNLYGWGVIDLSNVADDCGCCSDTLKPIPSSVIRPELITQRSQPIIELIPEIEIQTVVQPLITEVDPKNHVGCATVIIQNFGLIGEGVYRSPPQKIQSKKIFDIPVAKRQKPTEPKPPKPIAPIISLPINPISERIEIQLQTIDAPKNHVSSGCLLVSEFGLVGVGEIKRPLKRKRKRGFQI